MVILLMALFTFACSNLKANFSTNVIKALPQSLEEEKDLIGSYIGSKKVIKEIIDSMKEKDCSNWESKDHFKLGIISWMLSNIDSSDKDIALSFIKKVKEAIKSRKGKEQETEIQEELKRLFIRGDSTGRDVFDYALKFKDANLLLEIASWIGEKNFSSKNTKESLDNCGRTFLHRIAALKLDNSKDADLLINIIKDNGKANFNVNVEDEKGVTPLHLAATNPEYIHIALELLRAGADIAHQDKNKNNPLHVASFSGNTAFVAVTIGYLLNDDEAGENNYQKLSHALKQRNKDEKSPIELTKISWVNPNPGISGVSRVFSSLADLLGSLSIQEKRGINLNYEGLEPKAQKLFGWSK